MGNESTRATKGNESFGLVHAMDKGLDDIRAVITCRVCVRPLYEPFTIECGHTFCYSCLISWFEKNAANKTCPDCRAKVTRKPAPAYLVRDITQLFSNRAELLPAGETTQEHQNQQQEESRMLEEDRNGLGIFRGCFKLEYRHAAGSGHHIIIDDEDGVHRCPRCTWEIEDGECAGCGWPGYDSEGYDSEESIMEDDVDVMGRDWGNVMEGLASDSGFSIDTDENYQEHEDVDEEESEGSLARFVVNDEEAPQVRPSSIPRSQGYLVFSSDDGDSNSDSETASHPPGHTSNDETDVDQGLEGHTRRIAGAASVDSVNSDDPPDATETPARNVRSARSRIVLDDSDDEAPALIPRARPLPRRQSNQGRRSREGETQHPRTPVYEIASDSDEPITGIRSNRSGIGLEPSTVSDQGILAIFRNQDGFAERDNGRRSVQRQVTRNMQPPRRKDARSRAVPDDEDEYEYEHEHEEPRERGPVFETFAPTGPQLAAQREAEVSHQRVSEQNGGETFADLEWSGSDEEGPHFDPVTSIPIHRENVNMPGAFPPSFVSEQGQSQPAPLLNVQPAHDLTNPPLPHRSSSSRHARPSESHGQGFLDRRRDEEQATHTTHAEHTRHRDRSAAKAARRQERQRVKAEQEAYARMRGGGGPSGIRGGGGPSAPPALTSRGLYDGTG